LFQLYFPAYPLSIYNKKAVVNTIQVAINALMISSHRARLEQKRLVKRILLTFGAAVGAVVILVYVGFPMLARLVLFTSSFKRDTQENEEESKFILPPVLDPLP